MKLCECGCGQVTPLAKRTLPRLGHVKGEPVRFMPSHTTQIQAARERKARMPLVLCACGCGQPTKPSPHRPGQMNKYVHGHNTKVAPTRYRGGRVTTASRGGYISILSPSHPRAGSTGYVKEHILLAERALGHPLPPKAEVHHVNCNPADNTPGNLVVCPNKSYHMLLHRRRNALKASGHADWIVRCHFCGGYGHPDVMTMRKGTSYGFHAECRRAYRRAQSAERRGGDHARR
jgi:hypothetical protein